MGGTARGPAGCRTSNERDSTRSWLQVRTRRWPRVAYGSFRGGRPGEGRAGARRGRNAGRLAAGDGPRPGVGEKHAAVFFRPDGLGRQRLQVFLAMALYNEGEGREAVRLLLKTLTAISSDPRVQDYQRAIEHYADDLDGVQQTNEEPQEKS
ncbi:tetratricopeptide repeat protein [Streptomyces sp. CMB-StM0423]|uniref:tetratricopeptide repeat protein n=1 Tax=Streptomyces sp. CMB-StM0423 TaxID=2059884 RepID=UPI00227966C2|nr:tetratricopeptide repeat protein [Streptomyces sp. CMB-StM0423]